MNRHFFCLLTLLLCLLSSPFHSFSQSGHPDWQIRSTHAIEWSLEDEDSLPHTDKIEMAGRRVAAIVHYQIDSLGLLSVQRDVIFPQFHPLLKETDPDWYQYRAYLRKQHTDEEILPRLYLGDRQLQLGPVQRIRIDGSLSFEHQLPAAGLILERRLFPSPSTALFVEQWTLTNPSDSTVELFLTRSSTVIEGRGKENRFFTQIRTLAPVEIKLAAGQRTTFSVRITARGEGEEYTQQSSEDAWTERSAFLTQLSESLQLESPDSVLNTLFHFSKIRASESIFDSRLGLIHSPGGGRYYLGIWANDQAEYVGPFFPYLGYPAGNASSLNAYRAFAGEMNETYEKIRYAFEIEGLVPPFMIDRGDAAMMAYGAAQYCLALGDRAVAEELWPFVEWCLEYCRRQLNDGGVVRSESDEMEGRIETGTANLSTSSLYYGALRLAVDLGRSLDQKPRQLQNYEQQADQLAQSIEQYFGAKVEGLNSYRYYEGHEQLRHWVCLPLVVGLHGRKEGTIEALFDRLWTDNGVHVEKNSQNPAIANIFWDRGTLYALRGTFLAGATDQSLQKLQSFSRKRLLGKRVPYVVEAYPEGDMAHLSAESGLYCRVFTEGLFGIRPTGLRSFACQPRLPESWDQMALRRIQAFGHSFDLEVLRQGDQQEVRLLDSESGLLLSEKMLEEGTPLTFTLPN